MRTWRSLLGSVRVRTALAAAVTVGLILGIASVEFVRHLSANVVTNAQATASVRAHDAATLLADGDLPRRWSLPDDKTAFVQVVRGTRVVAATSNLAGAAPVLTTTAVGPRTINGVGVDPDAPFRVVELLRSSGNQRYEIIAGTSMDDAQDAVAETRLALTGGVPGVVLLVGLLTWLAAGRALRPVEQLRSDVELITNRDLSRRVEQPAGSDEISRLARTMNHMLDKIDQSVQAQNSFVADASHELRNPLAALRAELEIALSQPGRTPWERVVDNALSDARRIEDLARDLLLLARLDAGPAAPTARIDLARLAREAIHDATFRSLEVTTHADQPVLIVGNGPQLGRLLGNLLSNAERHAHHQVLVAVRTVAGAAELTVGDDGDGFAAVDAERIFERFYRLDSARSRDAGGSGLGLAIARDIARLHGGTIVATRADDRTTFTVTIPLAEGMVQ